MDEPPPIRPKDSDCCGNGCTRCVFDIYEEEYRVWQKRLERNNQASSGNNVLTPDAYSTLVVSEIERVNGNTCIYTFTDPDGRSICKFGLGQHVVIKAKVDNDEWIYRPYTPVDIDASTKRMKLLIKVYEHGEMSSAIQKWSEGSLIECRGPSHSEINYTRNKWDSVILMAAGTGIAPLFNIAQHILNEEDDTTICLLYTCRYYDELLLKSQIQEWTDHWNFHAFYFLTQESAEALEVKRKYSERVFSHRINYDSLARLTEEMNIEIESSFIFLCGTNIFVSDMKKLAQRFNVKPENVYPF